GRGRAARPAAGAARRARDRPWSGPPSGKRNGRRRAPSARPDARRAAPAPPGTRSPREERWRGTAVSWPQYRYGRRGASRPNSRLSTHLALSPQPQPLQILPLGAVDRDRMVRPRALAGADREAPTCVEARAEDDLLEEVGV